MSNWLEALGEWSGVPQMVNDIATDWSSAFEPEDQNVLISTLKGGAGYFKEGLGWAITAPARIATGVGSSAQATGGALGRAATAADSLNHPEWGRQMGMDERQYKQFVLGSVFDTDAKASPGQIASAAGNPFTGFLFNGLWGAKQSMNGAKYNANPYLEQDRIDYFGEGKETLNPFNMDAPLQFSSGLMDFNSSNMFDPTNLAGPAFKGYKAVALGEKALVGTKVTSIWNPASVVKEDFLGDLMNSSKYDDFVYFASQEKSAARLAEHDWIRRGTRDPQLAAYMLAKATDRQSVVDTLNVLGKLGDETAVQESAARLLSRDVDQGENAYLLDRIMNGEAERAFAARTGSDHINDPQIITLQKQVVASYLNDESSAIGRAYQASLNKAMDAPVGSLVTTPKTGRAAKWSADAATRKGNSLYSKPNVVLEQPTKAHPIMAFADFFTKGRPSGYANTHDVDSFKEFSALVQHIDKYTKGAISANGSAEAWSARYMAATNPFDRMQTFRMLEEWGAIEVAARQGIDPETAKAIYEHTYKRRGEALDQYSKDGFFSTLTEDGSPALTVGPMTMRQTANDVHIALDFRNYNKTLGRISPDGWKSVMAGRRSEAKGVGDFAQTRDWATTQLDMLNNLWKMNVLLRLGYSVRNLAEAGLSMAASGYLLDSILALRPGESAKAWAENRKTGIALARDRRGIRSGRIESKQLLQDEVGDAYAQYRAVQANERILTDYLSGFRIDARDVPDDLYETLARLRGEADRDVTYHVTTSALPAIDGDFLATVSNKAVAESRLGDYYTYIRPGDFENSHAGLLADARTRLANGEALEYKTPTGWAPMTEKTIASYERRWIKDGELRVPSSGPAHIVRARPTGAIPEVVAVPSYGKTLDARAGIAGVDVNDRAALAAYARENGYGRAVVDDPQWGETTLVLRDTADYAGGSGAAPVMRRNMDAIIRDAEENGSIELMPRTRKQIKRANKMAKNRDATEAGARARTNGRRAVIPGWTRSQVKAMVDAGIEDQLRRLGNEKAIARAKIDFAESRYNARLEQIAKFDKPRRQSHMGAGEAFDASSAQAQVMRQRSSSESTQDKLIGNGMDELHSAGTQMVPTQIGPDESRYFEAWSNTINHHVRDPESRTVDPLFTRIFQGHSEEEVADWLMGPGGRQHADSLGWTDEAEIEKGVADAFKVADLYMPEGPLRDAVINGDEITEQGLREAYGKRTDLPVIHAQLVPTAAERRAENLASHYVRRGAQKVFHFLGALPETTFARHPMFVAAYNREKQRMVADLRAKGVEHVTLENYNKIEAQAREFARTEVNKNLFTITQRTDAARQLRLISPFYGAWENGIKRWSSFVWHNPDKVARLSSKAVLVANNVTIVDQNGDPMTLSEAISDYDKFKSAQIVWPGYDKTRPESAARINLASLDVVTGGQPGPGLGPLGLLPLYEVAKGRPEAAEALSWAFPVGLPKSEENLFLSTWQQKVVSAVTEDQTFVNDMNKVYQAEYIKWQTGQRATKPEVEEVRGMAKQLYMLKTLSSLTLPASVDQNNEVDFYVNQLRTLRDLYRDEPFGSQKADAEFLDKHPEAFIVLPSLSDNRTSALATVKTVDNMKRYGQLAQDAEALGDLKMFGWVANYGQTYSKDDYSQAAYTWQTQNRLPGSDTTYRGRQNTADLEREALAQVGWVQFGKVMDTIETRMAADGIDPTSKRGAKVLSQVRQDFANHMKQTNMAWYQDYADPDRGKWERRAQFFTSVLGDETFMRDHGNDPIMQYIGSYLAERNKVALALQARDERGGSGSLTAKSNADINDYWQRTVESMKASNIEFAAWQTRYFSNDPVVF